MDRDLDRRLAVLEALLHELKKSNALEHKRIEIQLSSLSKHVNDQLEALENRVLTLEMESATSSLKWNILKVIASFSLGGLITLLISELLKVI